MDFSFLRRPLWMLWVVLATTAIVTFIALGFWQLRRLDERRIVNATLEGRETQPVASVDELLETSEVKYRPVHAEGRYAVAEEVLLNARSFLGRSGHHVLTPLQTNDGHVVIVDRGWVPADVEGPPVATAAPVSLDVTVRGVALPTETRGSLGPVDPADGVLNRIARVDIERLDRQVSGRLVPFYIRLVEQEPPQAAPEPVPVDTLDEGPHLSYAVQWFLFAVVFGVGMPTLIVQTARTGRGAGRGSKPEGNRRSLERVGEAAEDDGERELIES